ncbi:MAG: glycosyltransferase [Acidobacteria bacterium]|nr:MAG: glycosyltransferase [Acidobacteriota bacterium]RPJ84266.1 MAG: glycosyltransferase [Acidobacteriota bacterium]
MKPRLLYLVEGNTDIRFVVGLAEISELTMIVPERAYRESGLDGRVADSGVKVDVVTIPGGRLGFQLRSLAALWSSVRRFDVVLSQEMLRGSLNANIAGRLRHVPVAVTMALDPVEYFRCRRERGQIGPATAAAGEALLRSLLTVNGRLATRALALGPYLKEVVSRYSRRVGAMGYYGVDVSLFRPATRAERVAIRSRLDLPPDAFIVLFSSRVSHEKDPETIIDAAAMARKSGLNVVVLNLGGGFRQFLDLAARVSPGSEGWVLGRPAVHPMTQDLADYFRAADVVAQASLAEGLGLAPLEALACGTPVVATNVGGMAAHLGGLATLTPRRDARAMAEAFVWVARQPAEACRQAMRGREYVVREWSSARVFEELSRELQSLSRKQSSS